MRTLGTVAGLAILVAGTSSAALAQYQPYAYQPGYGQPAYGYAAPGCGGYGQPACANNALGGALGGAATGAAIGGIAGGGKGAGIGAGIGGLVGLGAVLLTRGPEAQLPRGTTLDIVLERELALDSSYVQFANTGRAQPITAPSLREQ